MAYLTNEAAARSSFSYLSLSSTDHQNHYTYEVFLSFRGKDTRYTFTDHLYNALCQRGIETFRDDKLRRGEEISQELLKAIEDSRLSIIVFSQNYAASRWCLDELVKILECRKSIGQEVRAIFYKVDPSDVRNQSGAFGDAFAMLDQCKYKDSMGKWKAALKEATDLSGWPLKDGEYEGKFINDIVGELSTQVVNPSCELQVAAHPIGLESCRQDVNRLLDVEEIIPRMVGIWGPGGIGKTTIAKDVFNSIRHKFEGSCFLADVRSKSNSNSSSIDYQNLTQLQETFLSDILRNSILKVSSVDQGVSFIRKRMRHKKVLLILDDVSHSSQLQYLAPSSDCFGPGSRIIITTRDKRWLTAHRVDSVYEVNMLDDRQALNLFSLNAFKRNGPPRDYLEFAHRVVRYAQGLPLALIVLGSHLFRKSKDEWKATLDSCKREDPHREIRNILKISYDSLGLDLQGYFLDIACFFKDQQVDRVKPILEACYDLKSVTGIAQLQEKALIRIDRVETWYGEKDYIWMHDLIEEMDKEIVYQESPGEPGKRSRIWSKDDVNHVLTNNTGTNKVIGIGIRVKRRSSTISLNAKSFSLMKNLKYIHMGQNLEYEWLDILDSRGITRLWEGRKNRLTCMNLRGCDSLTGLPNFREIPNLRPLDLSGTCKKELHSSITILNGLEQLTLMNCKNLTTLLYNIYKLHNLEFLNVNDCPRLATFPKIPIKMDSLRRLFLQRSDIRELDESIRNLIGLEWLDLNHCKNLTTLPCSIYELQNLELLTLDGCSKLVRFPRKTKILNVDGSSLSLPKLGLLSIRGCSLLSDCDFLKTLDCWEILEWLNLSRNNFVSLPACFTKFVNLRRLDLSRCNRLRGIPELPPNVGLDISGCESLIEAASPSVEDDWESSDIEGPLSSLEEDFESPDIEGALWSLEEDCESPDIEGASPSIEDDDEEEPTPSRLSLSSEQATVITPERPGQASMVHFAHEMAISPIPILLILTNPGAVLEEPTPSSHGSPESTTPPQLQHQEEPTHDISGCESLERLSNLTNPGAVLEEPTPLSHDDTTPRKNRLKCGDLDDARKVFDEMLERNSVVD
ncbi:disease resistance protein RUN1-like [Rosa rugosa]|uniref:disease resistance protein RUN1-like n=1 Tax=Rosa rugosa TaxID=74645 RepID=UPI002B409B8E|nr:disease resistance protein RUN1-like [Rosa rugosa]